MREPQTITIDHVRALLDAQPGSMLGLIEGRVDVIDADQVDSEDYRGALEVVTHDELVERLAGNRDDDELATQADALTVAVRQLGG